MTFLLISMLLAKRPYRPSVFQSRKRRINLVRPPGYRTNQSWQDWRAMKYIARRPIRMNFRTGGFIGKELKFVDYTRQQAAATGGVWYLADPPTGALNAVAQGDGESQRIGRKYSSASLHIRGTYSLSNPNANNGCTLRVVIFRDTQSNGAAPTPLNVMNAGINGFRNLEYVSRFAVMYDKTFTLNPSIAFNTSTTQEFSSNPERYFSMNFKLSGDILANGPNADISDIVDTSYHVMICASASAAILFSYSSRYRYRG